MVNPAPSQPHPKPLASIPKPQRPPHGNFLHAITFIIVFNTGIILTNLFQLILYPLHLVPLTRPHYKRVITFTKGTFGNLCVLITQHFAPTKYVITAGEGIEDDWIVRGAGGEFVGLRLPDKAIWVANHQTLCDWLFLWTFAYLSGHHRAILITLKASIKYVPFVGWACSIFNFIFLARNWLQDQGPFRRKLQYVGRELVKEGKDGKLALLLFPEGTLVTGNTRPKSRAFADKMGLDDLKYTLLPRSTGLFFALRTLAPTVPDLHLLDLTIGFPHVPNPQANPGQEPTSYPEDHYNLSLWTKNVPPDPLHFHLRAFTLADIPLGDFKSGGDATPEERAAFDEWLRARWTEKDALMERFYETGGFVEGAAEGKMSDGAKERVEWQVGLKGWWEHAEAFGYGLPVVVLWVGVPWVWAVVRVVVGLMLGWGHDVSLERAGVLSPMGEL